MPIKEYHSDLFRNITRDNNKNVIATESDITKTIELFYKNQKLYYTERCQMGYSIEAGSYVWCTCTLANSPDEIGGESVEMLELFEELAVL